MNTQLTDRRSFKPTTYTRAQDYDFYDYENRYVLNTHRISGCYQDREPGPNWQKNIYYRLSLYSEILLYCIDYNDEVENIINNKECQYNIKKNILQHIKENIKYKNVNDFKTYIYFVKYVNNVDLVKSLFYDLELYVKKKYNERYNNICKLYLEAIKESINDKILYKKKDLEDKYKYKEELDNYNNDIENLGVNLLTGAIYGINTNELFYNKRPAEYIINNEIKNDEKYIEKLYKKLEYLESI